MTVFFVLGSRFKLVMMEVSAVPVSQGGGTLSLLRAAAEELAAEESLAGLDGLLVAADEIASERGLMSPLRHASPERGFEEYAGTANSAVVVDAERDRETHRDTHTHGERETHSARDAHRDEEAAIIAADAAALQRALSPSPRESLSLAATTGATPAPLCTSSPPGVRGKDLAQTLDLRARRSILKNNSNGNGNNSNNNENNDNNNNNNKSNNNNNINERIARARALSAQERDRERERRERETQRYLHLLSHNARTQHAQSARSSLSHTHSQSVSLSVSLSATTAATTRSLSARRSALSQRLMHADRVIDTHTHTETERAEAKPVRESLFRSDAEEKLFRAMHTVSVSSHTHSHTHRDRDRDRDSKEDEKKRECAERDSKDTSSQRQKDKEKERDREQERRRAIERLSRPSVKSPTPAQRRSDPLLRYLTFEEARESTFRPSKHTHKKKGNRDADAKQGRDDDNRNNGNKEDASFAFVRRQEAELRAREEERRFLQGQADYDAKLNKKHCPRCGAAQSYDEVREKRKQCPHCRVNYTLRKTWNSSSAKLFFAACARHAKDAQRRKEELLREVERELKTFTVQRVDPHTGKVVSVRVDKSQDVVLTREEEEDFLLRLDEYRAQREARLKALEKSVYEESCPFRPTLHRSLSASNRKHKDDSDFSDVDEEDGEGETNPVQAFLRRYEEDMQQRMQTMPHRFKHRSQRREDKKGSGTESEGEGSEDPEQGENRHTPKPFRFGLTI